MESTNAHRASSVAAQDVQVYDTVIIGAGIGGLYQLYKLREAGLRVIAVDAGTSVGGTWYWNRYPGARVDSPSHVYQYWFSEELNNAWNWRERFPAQPETERYLNFVADRYHLRKDIQLSTRVLSCVFDEGKSRWRVRCSNWTIEARMGHGCMRGSIRIRLFFQPRQSVRLATKPVSSGRIRNRRPDAGALPRVSMVRS
ncbi:NAD(P)-binding protein [Pseudomonas sp. H11T01]|uniref:NAD(P)-binding protein n=1 Tax=Pseudomonas sp. H11T01 TaxID=3402749 RepID=UPI003ACF1851